jgi:hypothetical protein
MRTKQEDGHLSKRLGVAALLALSGPALGGTLDGVWTGDYVCAQGDTRLELFVTTTPGGAPNALFHFGDGSPTRPEGCFAMEGAQVPGGLTFTATRWVLRPAGYVTVNLLGSVAGARYAGWVAGPGCTSFSLTRQPLAPLPAACEERDSTVS